MKLASWNVNSIRMRRERLLGWVAANSPDVLCLQELKATEAQFPLAWGLEDTFRLHHQEGGFYSWWDYRMLSFPKNDGLRLDLILATAGAARGCTEASIDRNERKGKLASDHAPVRATLSES